MADTLTPPVNMSVGVQHISKAGILLPGMLYCNTPIGLLRATTLASHIGHAATAGEPTPVYTTTVPTEERGG